MKKSSILYRMILIILLGGVISIQSQAQEKKGMLRDTLDSKFDLSNYIINMHGFVPYPMIISEPALGNFGGALALVFMSPKKNTKEKDKFHSPDITGVAGLYTLNNTWGAGALRQGSFPSIGLRYTAAICYANINLNFYREIPEVGEKEYEFNLKPALLMLDVSENLFRNRIFLGTRYMFSNVMVGYNGEVLPDTLFDEDDFDKNLGTLGLYAELDYRNSIFTPDRGIRLKTTYSLSRSWTGSDFDFENFEFFTHVFFQPYHFWVCGLRAETQIVSNNAPFYYYPFLMMRGIPMMRYQGQATLLFETEQRFDIARRWSLLGFVGTGRTWSDSEYMEDNTWHTAGGVGFRYLIARLFRLRMGVDIAVGQDQFAYYIVFGHYWNK
jgi:hypothetical protein